MSTALFGKGARGHLVEVIQRALYIAGFGEARFDGAFDETTIASVTAFQTARGLGRKNHVDRATWGALVEAPVPALSERCIALALWVGGRAYADTRTDQSSGMLSWGIVPWALDSADLRDFLLELERSHPHLISAAFGLLAGQLSRVLRSSSIDVQLWANRVSDNHARYEPWAAAFARLAEFSEVQVAQRQLAIRQVFPRALYLADRLGLRSERGIALCFLLSLLSPGLAKAAALYEAELRARPGSEPERRQWLTEQLALHGHATNAPDLTLIRFLSAMGGTARDSDAVPGCWGLSERAVSTNVEALSERAVNGTSVRKRAKAKAPAKAESSTAPVRLAVATPNAVSPGETFVAMLSAYPAGREEDVKLAFANHTRRAAAKLGMKECQWRYGETVRVILSGKHLQVRPHFTEFTWRAGCELASFAVEVDQDAPLRMTLLEYSVFIRDACIAYIPIELEICHDAEQRILQQTDILPGRSGFASYASADRDAVLHRVSELRRSAGVDVFIDCIDLRASEEWKPALEKEIGARDLFFLFWSSHARQSQWVDWEWRLALKMNKGIRVRPLEPADRAPPPEELRHLHFNDVYMLVAQSSRQAPSAGA